MAVDQNGHQRNSDNTFVHGVTGNQSGAGIQPWDTPGTAQDKVDYLDRVNSGQQLYPSAPIPIWIWKLCMIVISAVLVFLAADASRAKVTETLVVWDSMYEMRLPFSNYIDPKSHWEKGVIDSMHQSALQPDFTKLFKTDAPISQIFSKCERPCFSPDIKALDAYKIYAKQPATYEQDVCNSITQMWGESPLSLTYGKATWVFDRQAKKCVATNASALKDIVRRHNESAMVKWPPEIVYFAMLIIGTLVFWPIYRVLFRKGQ